MTHTYTCAGLYPQMKKWQHISLFPAILAMLIYTKYISLLTKCSGVVQVEGLSMNIYNFCL
jgi:hypothetical protein